LRIDNNGTVVHFAAANQTIPSCCGIHSKYIPAHTLTDVVHRAPVHTMYVHPHWIGPGGFKALWKEYIKGPGHFCINKPVDGC